MTVCSVSTNNGQVIVIITAAGHRPASRPDNVTAPGLAEHGRPSLATAVAPPADTGTAPHLLVDSFSQDFHAGQYLDIKAIVA
jgi:hypothetical protein